ncbi:MAG: Gfo/Idh/MocA family oxidoreductase [Patescibacteria group bacterium]
MSVAPVTIGIVGLGYWGPNVLRNFAALPDCTVQYGCDMREEALAALRRKFPTITFTQKYDDLLRDASLEAVVIATPTASHYPLAKEALEAGKHILIEKPMTGTVAEAEELVKLAERKNLQLLVDHTFVYTGAVRKIRDLVRSGEIGELHYFDSTRINLGLIQKDTNVLWDLAIHDLSILSVLTDLATLTSLYAHGSTHYTKQQELAHLHMTFRSGFEAHIHVSWLSPVKIRQTIIGGSKKMILYDDTHPSEKIRIYDKGVHFEELVESNRPDPFFPVYRSGDILIPKVENPEALRIEAEHFLRCIRGKEKPRVSGEDGAAIVRILTLANQSMAERRPLNF